MKKVRADLIGLLRDEDKVGIWVEREGEGVIEGEARRTRGI